MFLDSNQKQELMSCINSRIESREDLIKKIVQYFGDLKATGREWKIKMNIGYRFHEIEISKPEYYNKTLKKLHWWQKPDSYEEELCKIKNKMSIEVYPIDKSGYRKYSESKKYYELEYRDLLDLSTKLDDILINICAQEDCKLDDIGPFYTERVTSKEKEEDKIKEEDK
jgi:hypothetical protein